MPASNDQNIEYTYGAFISYRHVDPDRQWAMWLHKELETYRVPKKLQRIRDLPPKIGTIFRDEEELAASSDLSEEIKGALKESKFLIVVCSPRTPDSDWVNAEIQRFRELERERHVLAFLIEGEPNSAFPTSLREIRRKVVEKGGVSHEELEETEPLAADVRLRTNESPRFVKRMAKLRLLAPLLGCRFDELRQREQERQTKRQFIVSLTLAGLFIVMSALAGFALFQKGQAEQKTRIVTSQLLATEAGNVRQDFPQRSLLLAVEALQTTTRQGEPPVPVAVQALRNALAYSGGWGLSGHDKDILTTLVSPNGQRLFTGSKDGTARMWDLSGNDPTASSKIFSGHENGVRIISVSPNGNLLLTGGEKGKAYLWDLTLPDPASQSIQVLDAKDSILRTGGFTSDSRGLVVEGKDDERTLRVWTMPAGGSEPVLIRTLNIPDHNLGFDDQASFENSIILSKDSKWLAALISYFPEGYAKFETLVWDMEKSEASPTYVFGGGTDALAISPNNRWLVTTNEVPNEGHVANVWDLKAESPVLSSRTLHGHGYFIRSLAFSSDSRWLITGSWDNSTRVWDLEKENPEEDPIKLLYGADVVAFSPDSQWIVTAGKRDFSENTLTTDNQIYVWDLKIKKSNPEKKPLVLRGHENIVKTVSFTPDSKLLVSGSSDSTVRMWDLSFPSLGVEPLILSGHEDEVYSLAIDEHNKLVSGSIDQKALVWDLNASQPGANSLILDPEEDASASSVAISSDGRWIVTRDSSEEFDVHSYLWDLQREDGLNTPILMRHEGPVLVSAFSPKNKWLVTGGSDKTVRMWDLRAEDPLAQPIILNGHSNAVLAVAFSPDEKWLATAGWDTEVRLWNLTSQDPSANAIVLTGHEDRINDLTISSDKEWLVSGSVDKTARLWDLANIEKKTEPVVVLNHDSDITHVEISPDSHWLVISSHSMGGRLWDLSEKLDNNNAMLLGKHLRGITDVAFSTDNQWLATASYDNNTYLWNLNDENPASNPVILRGSEIDQAGTIYSVVFSEDNHWLITGGSDGRIRLWNLRLPDLIGLARRVAGRDFLLQEMDQYEGLFSLQKN